MRGSGLVAFTRGREFCKLEGGNAALATAPTQHAARRAGDPEWHF